MEKRELWITTALAILCILMFLTVAEQSQALGLSPVSTDFSTYPTGWTAIHSSTLPVLYTGAVCLGGSGNCIGDSGSSEHYAEYVGTPVYGSGSMEIPWKGLLSGSGFEILICSHSLGICSNNSPPSNPSTIEFTNHSSTLNDGTWHKEYFFWQDNGSGFYETCSLVDDSNESDCAGLWVTQVNAYSNATSSVPEDTMDLVIGNETYAGPIGPVTPPDTSTRIVSLSPVDNSTTASTTVTLSVEYYDNSGDGEDLTKVGYSLFDISQGYAQIFNGPAATASLNADTTYSTTTVLNDEDTYIFSGFLTNDAGDAFLSANSATLGVNVATYSSQFLVASGTVSTYSACVFNSSISTSTCGIANITGCFQNALIWAFCPSPQLLQTVASDGSLIKNKPPFGYIFVNIQALQMLSASTTPPAFALEEDWPIMHYIFQPLTEAMAGLIWYFFLVWFFHRVRDIEV